MIDESKIEGKCPHCERPLRYGDRVYPVNGKKQHYLCTKCKDQNKNAYCKPVYPLMNIVTLKKKAVKNA